MEANLRPIEGAFNSAIEALHIDGLGASQQNTLEHDPKLGSRNPPSGLLAMELFKILWDFGVVCLNAPNDRSLMPPIKNPIATKLAIAAPPTSKNMM